MQVVKPSAGPSSTIELDIGPKPVTLYHFGDLSNGVSGTQRLSTSPVSDLSHYRSGGKLYEFAVPADVYNNWLLDNTIQRFNDLHAPTGIITPEVRIMPPATAEMNNYLLPREPR